MKKVFIVAEIGINHNGDLTLAKQLISAAKGAGVDAVKFQKRTLDKVYTKDELDKPREHPMSDDKTNRGQKTALEFGKIEYDEIDKYCNELGIIWFASCWDLESQEFVKQYELEYNKVASAMLTHIELLDKIAEEKKMTFISTGMSTMEEIDKAVSIFTKHECPFQLWHCNSQYPTPNDKLNLNGILRLKEQYECEIGYSCHSSGIIPVVGAVSMGAVSIEKHITLDRTMYGSDQSASVEPNGLSKMVEYIRLLEVALGDGKKVVTEAEEQGKAKLRRDKDY